MQRAQVSALHRMVEEERIIHPCALLVSNGVLQDIALFFAVLAPLRYHAEQAVPWLLSADEEEAAPFPPPLLLRILHMLMPTADCREMFGASEGQQFSLPFTNRGELQIVGAYDRGLVRLETTFLHTGYGCKVDDLLREVPPPPDNDAAYSSSFVVSSTRARVAKGGPEFQIARFSLEKRFIVEFRGAVGRRVPVVYWIEVTARDKAGRRYTTEKIGRHSENRPLDQRPGSASPQSSEIPFQFRAPTGYFIKSIRLRLGEGRISGIGFPTFCPLAEGW